MKSIARVIAALSIVGTLTACGTPDTAEPKTESTETAAGGMAATEVAATSPARAEAEEAIRIFLLKEYPDAGKIMYALAWRDLNADGAEEAVVYLAGPYFCGTGGCSLLILTQAGPMWSKAGYVSTSRTPVTVLDSQSSGWNDLTVHIAGGGGPSGTVVLKYDGKAYPGNASIEPAAPGTGTGTELLPEEPTFTIVETETPAT